MPNRILREGILTSESVCSLGWAEEVFYRRLASIVDDYGRHDANPKLLRSRCYPLQTDDVQVTDIDRWMRTCQKAGLIRIYHADGKCYLEVCKFGQQQRSTSKCPPPPASDNKCYQPIANEHLDVFGVGVEDGVVFEDEVVVGDDKTPRKRSSRPAGSSGPPAYGDLLSDVDPQVVDDWVKLRKAKKATVTRTAVEELILEAGKAGYTPESALKECCARGWAGFKASWIARDSPGLSAGLNKQEALEASNLAAAERFSKGVANGVF